MSFASLRPDEHFSSPKILVFTNILFFAGQVTLVRRSLPLGDGGPGDEGK